MSNLNFSKKGYLKIIKATQKKGYTFCSFNEAYNLYNKGIAPLCILRHDVDVCLTTALEMAEFEAKLGISSTYFILLYNELYNPLSPKGRSIVRKIAELNHEIGLHWNSLDYENTNFEEKITRDIKILESITKKKVVSAAQHKPNASKQMDISKYFENNAYEKRFIKDFAYVSDSSMRWRLFTPLDTIKERKNLQFLSHPIWWFSDGASIKEKIYNAMRKDRKIRNLIYEELVAETEKAQRV